MKKNTLKNTGKVLAAAGAAAFILNVTGCAQYAPASGNASLANCGKAVNACKSMNKCKGHSSCGTVTK